MPELPASRVSGQARRMMWSIVCVLPICGAPAGVLAQNVPAGLRACAAVSDSARRLACYDREMARLSAPAAPPAAEQATPTAPGTPTPSNATIAAAPVAPSTPIGPTAPTATTATASTGSMPPKSDLAAQSAPAPASQAASSTPPPPPASPETSAPHRASLWNIFRSGPSDRVTAHIAGLDRWPNAMVLHLDNGQVWKQIGHASGDLSLQVGDSVTIEKHLGSYWLSSGHVSDMQVRLQPQQSP
jgi:hypothetical protein